jgi:hypothetical protein
VTVRVAVMPAGTEPDPARPHPSEHSPHLCLSLLSYGRAPRTAAARYRHAGSREQEIRPGYPPTGGGEVTNKDHEAPEHGDPSLT